MKTMQLSSIALVFLSLFNSCTKDSTVSSDSNLSSTSRTTVLGGKTANGNNAGANGPQTPL